MKLACVPIALSPHNPRFAAARALLDARARREQRRFAFEGPTLLAEASASGTPIVEVFATDVALREHAPLVDAAERAGADVFVVPERALARLSDVTTPTGLVAVAPLPAATVDAILARPGPVLLLAGITDPGNAGTLIRSADAFGAAGVLVGSGGVDPFSPKVVRAAMGSLFRLPVGLVGPEELLDRAGAAGRPVIAADLAGTPLGQALPPRNAVLAVGHERRGVGAFLPRWDAAVRIEQAGAAESLNAAVAGGILLYLVSKDA